MYVTESTAGTTGTSTTSPDCTWYKDHTTPSTFTTTNTGSYVTLYFDNAANKNSQRNSLFEITIECVNCCTAPTLSGCPAGGELELGNTATLSVDAGATVSSWTSSNTGVATIDNGVVTPVSTGSTTITANVAATNGFCAATLKCYIDVVAPPCTTPALTNCPAGNMTSGDRLQLAWNTSATPTGWSSSNSSVVSVSSGGLITAKAEGSATITSTVAANGDYCAGTLSCTVNVSCRNSGKTLSFTNSPLSATVTSGETFYTTVSNTSGRTVTYSSSNTSVATVDADGVVHAVGEGNATITASIASWTSNDTTYCAINSSNSIAITVPPFSCSGSNTESTVGDGTSSSYYEGPIQTNTAYSYRQIIYTPSEVGCTSGEIKAIGFRYSGTYAMTNKTNVKIYMGETAKTEFDNTSDWIASGGLTLVYSGSLNCSAQDWKWFQLNTPYSYTGGNLVVAILDDSGVAESGNSYTFYVRNFTSLGYKQLRCYDAYSALNTSSLPTGYRGTTRPLTKFCMTCCEKITSPLTFALSASTVSVAAGGSATVTLTNGTGRTVAWHSDDESVATVSAATSGSSITATVTGVAEGTAHITATVTGWDNGSGTTYCDTTLTFTVTVSDGCAKIGDGTNWTSSYPIRTEEPGKYFYTQQIYYASDIISAGGCAGMVSDIKFYLYSGSALTLPVEIYMGSSTATSLADGWITDADLTQVYTGDLTLSTTGWVTVHLATPYNWDGEKNIVVAFRNTSATTGYDRYFYCTKVTGTTRIIYSGSSFSLSGTNTPPDGGTTTSSNQRPNIKFCINCCDLEATIEFGE